MKQHGGSGDAARAPDGGLRMLQTVAVLLLCVCSLQSAAAQGDTGCGSNPCQNEAYCEDRKDSYVCVCQQGWKGANCDQDVDECQEVASACPDPNSRCVNTLGNFTCVCQDGYERRPLRHDDVCKEKVLLPYNRSRTIKYTEGLSMLGPYKIPGGFMIGDTYIENYYISVNGYIVFNSRYDEPFMASLNTSRLTYKSFLAPYWTSLDPNRNASEASGLYHSELSLAATSSQNDTKALFEEYTALMGLESFQPVYIGVVTWVDALPFKASDYQGMETATFQVAMATDGRRLKGRVAWRNTWQDLDVEKFRVQAYMHLSADTAQSWMPLNYSTPTYLNFSSSDALTPSSVRPCVDWIGTYGSELQKHDFELMACPGSLAQARVHPLYETASASSNSHRHCVIAKVFQFFLQRKKICCYRVADGVMLRGRTEIPLPVMRDARIQSLAEEGYAKCCEVNHTSMCRRFSDYFPVPKLYVNTLFSLSTALLWGNGHFTTINNATFTFNGWNEYLLLKFRLKSLEFQLQGRAEKENSQTYNTTFFTALAIQYGNATPAFELRAEQGQVQVYRSGQQVTPEAVGQEGSVVLHRAPSGDVLDLTFSLDLTMKVTASDNRLSVSILTFLPLFMPVDGLLGTNITLTNQTSEEEVFNSAQQWALTENDSLFTYSGQGQSFASYQHPGFVPTFLPSTAEELLRELNQTNKMAEGRSVCGENVACLQDLLVTGSGVRGQQTKKRQEDSRQLEETLKGEAPYFRFAPPVWVLGGRKDASYFFRVYDSKSTRYAGPASKVTIRGHSVPRDMATNFTVEKGSRYWTAKWNFGDNLTALTSLSVTITATNPQSGIVVEYQPSLLLCNCQGTCDYTAAKDHLEFVNSPYGGLEFADCQCNSSRGGRFCEERVDRCDVCYVPGFCLYKTWCQCPSGYYGHGKTCSEKNECLQPNRCSQVCQNTPGSYTCSCFPGYTLGVNGRCEDIDECQQQSHNCSATRFCVNTVGSFVCQCRPDFGGKDCQEDVKHRYGGQVKFADLPSMHQGWSDDLQRIDSAASRALSQKIESVISSLLRNRGIQFVQVSVLDFSHYQSARQRRSAGKQPALIGATFEVSTAQQHNVTSLQAAILSGFDPACTGSQCRLSGNSSDTSNLLYGVEKASFSFQEDYDLCGSERTNNCHNTSTTCVTVNATIQCQCRPGYKPWSLQDNICLDEDECLTNSTEALCGLASNSTQCRNTDGSYYCLCPASFRWDADTRKCVEVTLKDVCTEKLPCKNGAECVNTMDEARYACRCTDGWTGADCGQEDGEAERFRSATIGVSVTLAIVCLIIIVVVVVIVRRGRENSPEVKPQVPIDGYSSPKKLGGDTGGHTHSAKGPTGQVFSNQAYTPLQGDNNVCERM